MGEWLSLWGKRKDEIERRDWRRNKQEKVGEMERRRKREKCREKLKLEEEGFIGKPRQAAEKPG